MAIIVVSRFLVLFRHMALLVDKRNPVPHVAKGQDGFVHEHTVVMDGTMVCFANRHAYPAGRTHSTVLAQSHPRPVLHTHPTAYLARTP
jgi:hypothetical protein